MGEAQCVLRRCRQSTTNTPVSGLQRNHGAPLRAAFMSPAGQMGAIQAGCINSDSSCIKGPRLVWDHVVFGALHSALPCTLNLHEITVICAIVQRK